MQHYFCKMLLQQHYYILALSDSHVEQPHRLCIQQHSGTLWARRHDLQGAEELITHSLEPFPEKANRCVRNGAEFSLNALY